MPVNSLIVGVDLTPIKHIPGVITFQSDITTEKCRATIRSHLKTWKADCVLHDGAPNVGTAWVQDAFTQAELVLQSLRLATEFLMPGGNFVTKVFRSRDFNNLMWVFNQLFTKVEATKPPSSRNVSAEIFVVCMGFKAPKKIDPKFLDPRTVFEELPTAAPNNEAKVFQPEKKKRKRDGYEEGDYLQFKEEPISAFIEGTDPIQMLGSLNKLSFVEKEDDLVTKAIKALPETNDEIIACCGDLRVLGKKDFRKLLKWRLGVRAKFGLANKVEPVTGEETAEVAPMDEEMQIEEDLRRIKERELSDKKRLKRKGNEAKTKEVIRMQLHMGTPMEIGMEQEGDAMFKLRNIDRAGPDALKQISKGKMNVVVEAPSIAKDWDMGQYMGDEEDSDDETGNRLDEEMDHLFVAPECTLRGVLTFTGTICIRREKPRATPSSRPGRRAQSTTTTSSLDSQTGKRRVTTRLPTRRRTIARPSTKRCPRPWSSVSTEPTESSARTDSANGLPCSSIKTCSRVARTKMRRRRKTRRCRMRSRTRGQKSLKDSATTRLAQHMVTVVAMALILMMRTITRTGSRL